MKTLIRTILIASCALLLQPTQGEEPMTATATQSTRRQLAAQFQQQAIEESAIAIRPGQPEVTPFWNVKSHRFIYAPAFDFAPVEGAKAYRFTAQCGEKTFGFEADTPWAPLSPIWRDLPLGEIKLTVEALDAPQGETLGKAGERAFHKDASFKGFYRNPVRSYEESCRLGLKAVFDEPAVQNWLTSDEPDLSYSLNQYPSKMIAALMEGSAAYASLTPRPADADHNLEIARHAARYLMKQSNPADSPLAYLPPTYYVMDHGHMNANRIMMSYPAVVGLACLDFFDATGEQEYLDWACNIANTFKKLQTPEGSWLLFVEKDTGKPVAENLMNPTDVIKLLDQLDAQYGKETYRQATERAIRFIFDNPLKTYNWQAQFEDVTPMAPYENLSRAEVCEVAQYLLRHAEEHPDYLDQAIELMRFAEDQFVFWEIPHWAAKHWFTPAVGEQYMCYTPVNYSFAQMLDTFCLAYQVTGDALYLAKAQELANTLVFAQAFHGDGHIPTWVNLEVGGDWLNCSVLSARMLGKHADLLAQNPVPATK